MNLTSKPALPFIRNMATTAVIAGSLLMSVHASAASQCKGLENAACTAQASCNWVQGYERKDGRKVNAFCRTSAKKTSNKKAQKNQQDG